MRYVRVIILTCSGLKPEMAVWPNLRNKEYYVFNRPVGKAEFERVWSHYFSNNHSAIAELNAKFQQLRNSSFKSALPHPEERQKLRSLQFNPRKLRQSNCSKTGAVIQTSNPEDTKLILSETAYQQEVD